MELVVSLLVVWAMLVPFRLAFTAGGVEKRGRKLFVVFLLCVGIADVYELPERVMQIVERYERAKAGEVQRGRARVTDEARTGSAAPKRREVDSVPTRPSIEARRSEEAAARRARARYEAEQRRLEQSRTEQHQENADEREPRR